MIISFYLINNMFYGIICANKRKGMLIMEETNELELTLVWTLMPLSEEELEQIPPSHRIRPYLLCLEKEEYFYAFPATSQVFDSKIRYQNEKVILTAIDYRKSLINLAKIYQLPKENIFSDEYPIDPRYKNEIIKKIQANFDYGNYPEEVKEKYKNKQITFTNNDLVEIRGQLYVVIGSYSNEQLIVYPVYKYPVNKTIPKETDGLIYYVDTSNPLLASSCNIDRYCSQLFGLSYGTVKSESELKKLKTRFKSREKISTKKTFKNFGELEPGMIISYTYNNVIYKIIILENTGYDVEALIGNDKTPYSAFEPINLPVDIPLNYEITGTLNNERLEGLRTKSSYKLNGYDYSMQLKK